MFSAAGGGGGPASQTFVSATLGNDSNPCTRVSPCLTFAAALAQTTAGGEIDCPRSGRFRPGDHHQGGQHLRRRNERRRHDARPRRQRHRHQRRGQRHDLSARPDLRRRQCVRHLRHRVLERRAAANRKLPGPGLHHVRHHVVSRCRQRHDAIPGRSQHDDPQQRDRHLGPADRRHRGEGLCCDGFTSTTIPATDCGSTAPEAPARSMPPSPTARRTSMPATASTRSAARAT